MARLEGRSRRRGPFVRFAYWYSRRKTGKVMEPLAVAAHHPWIYKGLGAFELALERSRRVDPKLTKLAAMKAGSIVGCRW